MVTSGKWSLSIAIAVVLFAANVGAQSYPNKPVRWSIAGGAGGAYDVLARVLLPVIGTNMGQPQIMENRAGSSGIAGTDFVAKSAPDGYNLLFAGNTQFTLIKFTHANLPYDPQRDIAPISLLNYLSSVLFVSASLPINTMAELVAYSKANPGKLNYASGGIGHSLHLGMELLKLRNGLDATHVPYKTTPGALQDMFAERVQLIFYPPSSQLMAQIKAGKIRAIATPTEKRFPRLPDVPTFNELGITNYEWPGWTGVGAPAGTPREIITRWHSELVKGMNTPEVERITEQMAAVPAATTPEQMAQTIAREIALWGPVTKTLGIKPE
jgi:tripartite-type tricarboxylate transporter receptor subunit TctC